MYRIAYREKQSPTHAASPGQKHAPWHTPGTRALPRLADTIIKSRPFAAAKSDDGCTMAFKDGLSDDVSLSLSRGRRPAERALIFAGRAVALPRLSRRRLPLRAAMHYHFTSPPNHTSRRRTHGHVSSPLAAAPPHRPSSTTISPRLARKVAPISRF